MRLSPMTFISYISTFRLTPSNSTQSQSFNECFQIMGLCNGLLLSDGYLPDTNISITLRRQYFDCLMCQTHPIILFMSLLPSTPFDYIPKANSAKINHSTTKVGLQKIGVSQGKYLDRKKAPTSEYRGPSLKLRWLNTEDSGSFYPLLHDESKTRNVIR
ncbi:hypothetical protein ACFX2G_047752 [Malus domestica]